MTQLYEREVGNWLGAISQWVDDYPPNQARDPEARTWGRISKVGEEAGEVVEAYIGYTDQNPRKGKSNTVDDVADELLDTALTALAAWEHLSGNEGQCLHAFRLHVIDRMGRAGL